MTKIVRYLFGVEEAKTISTRTFDGQHWYAAVDICNLLGIENHSQAVHRRRQLDKPTLHSGEWRKANIYNGRSKRRMLLVTDSGMLKLILLATSQVAQAAQERARNTPPSLLPQAWLPILSEG